MSAFHPTAAEERRSSAWCQQRNCRHSCPQPGTRDGQARAFGAVGVAMRRFGPLGPDVLELETKLDFGLVAREIREIQ